MNRLWLAFTLVCVVTLISGCGQQNSELEARMTFSEAEITFSRGEMLRGFDSGLDYSEGPFEGAYAVSSDKELSAEVALEQAVTGKGSLSLWIKTDRLYCGGVEAQLYSQNLVEVEGLFKVKFSNLDSFVWIFCEWLDESVAKNSMHISLPRLPADTWINLAIVWDCRAGLFNCYINGTPYRDPDARMPGWEIGQSSKLIVYTGLIPVAEICLSGEIADEETISSRVGHYKGSLDRYIGAAELGQLDVESRKGSLLYSNELDSDASLDGWVIEGPAEYDFGEGWLDIRSKQSDGNHITGHIVNWCPEVFPGDFIAEWQVQVVSEYGLCIVFFSAEGNNGKSIFDPSLEKRNGVFSQYTKGEINSYHISYHAATPLGVRSMANLRKNSGFYLLSNGPVGIAYGSKDIHKVTVVKEGPHIQIAVDGRKIIDFVDDDKTYGPVWGQGRIGLRQMKWTRAKYRDFKVYAIK